MMIELLIIAGIIFGPWVLIGVALIRAPFGYEDETGFHYGEQDEH